MEDIILTQTLRLREEMLAALKWKFLNKLIGQSEPPFKYQKVWFISLFFH